MCLYSTLYVYMYMYVCVGKRYDILYIVHVYTVHVPLSFHPITYTTYKSYMYDTYITQENVLTHTCMYTLMYE